MLAATSTLFVRGHGAIVTPIMGALWCLLSFAFSLFCIVQLSCTFRPLSLHPRSYSSCRHWNRLSILPVLHIVSHLTGSSHILRILLVTALITLSKTIVALTQVVVFLVTTLDFTFLDFRVSLLVSRYPSHASGLCFLVLPYLCSLPCPGVSCTLLSSYDYVNCLCLDMVYWSCDTRHPLSRTKQVWYSEHGR